MRLLARRGFTASALLLPALALPALGHAQPAFPTRPITAVVAWLPGSGLDIIIRTMAAALQEDLGQPIIVENRPGAAGSIGAQAVARAAPDGHTLLLTASSLSMVQVMGQRVSFTVPDSFTPIVNLAVTPSFLLVHPALPVRTPQELIAYARARPGQVFYGSAGIGAPSHFVTELFRTRTGIEATNVPFAGSPQQMQALMAGDVQFSVINAQTSLPQIQAGTVRALAVTGADRVPQAPDVPTLNESGLPGFIAASYWNAVLGPAGVPMPVAERLAQAFNRALARPEVRDRLANTGNVFDGRSSPAAFAEQMREDMAVWAEVARAANIRAQ